MIAVSKLATDHWHRGRPLTVAIDTSIWAFQIQLGQKGSNPALRTFYYRLCRLFQLNVQPIFVFDGPKKPPFKRNQRTATFYNGQSFEETHMKALIRAFGFETWDAPGEAEAECALLQTLGIVDIVITEDVDCVMFGATKVAREIPDPAKRTHVDLFSDVESKTGLDRDGLILIAMMSGGDYLPAGIPTCGPKIAAEVHDLMDYMLTILDSAGRLRNFTTADHRL
jgi:holliday junction resolvase YEN1